MAVVNSNLSAVHKSKAEEEEAKRRAEEAIEKERKEHQEKVYILSHDFLDF